MSRGRECGQLGAGSRDCRVERQGVWAAGGKQLADRSVLFGLQRLLQEMQQELA